MKVGIKTGHRMDLAEGDINLPRQHLELLGGQVAELSLDGPQFVKHEAKLRSTNPRSGRNTGQ